MKCTLPFLIKYSKLPLDMNSTVPIMMILNDR
jgi:hypothetical protein